MSQEFKKVLVLDDRLKVSDDIDFSVYKGASSKVHSVFPAQAASTSQISFNIQVPSELTVISREAMIEGTFTLNISGRRLLDKKLIDYGKTNALCPFPLQSMFSTSTVTINNSSVSQNTKDVMDIITRSHDRRYLSRYNGMTPTAFDTYFNYGDAVGSVNNPNGGYENANDNDLLPRGAFNVTLGGVTDAATAEDGTPKTMTLTVTVTEPLLMSPFTFCDPSVGNQGMYGVQAMNFNFTLGTVQHILKGITADNTVDGLTVTLKPPEPADFKLHFDFLTAPNSVLLPPRNIVPYYELPIYKSPTAAITNGASANITSPSIQLNQIPDKLMIGVRKIDRGVSDSISFLPINNISITFNNVSGLLSNSTPQDLWRMSVNSGSNQSWLEFSGKSNKGTNGSTIKTTGSLLMLDFARDIPLSEEYYAPSSLGQFLLSFNLNVTNNTGADIASSTYELFVCTMNSGFMALERGTTSVYTAVLTKADVLDASQGEDKTTYSSTRRMVGGNLMNFLQKALPKVARVAKAVSKEIDHPMAQNASNVLGALGFGRSGGGVSGGQRMSGHLL